MSNPNEGYLTYRHFTATMQRPTKFNRVQAALEIPSKELVVLIQVSSTSPQFQYSIIPPTQPRPFLGADKLLLSYLAQRNTCSQCNTNNWFSASVYISSTAQETSTSISRLQCPLCVTRRFTTSINPNGHVR